MTDVIGETPAKTVTLKSLSESTSSVYNLDPRKIKADPDWNARETKSQTYKEHKAMLKASIKEVGVKEPLTVYFDNGEPWLTNGFTRLAAINELISEGVDIKSVPVRQEDKHANDEDRIFSQILRNSGAPFTPMEQGKVFKRLLDRGWKVADISAKMGKSKVYVGQLLELVAAPEPVKAMVRTGEVSATQAIKTLKENKGDGKAATEKLSSAVETAKASGKTKATGKDVKKAEAAKGKEKAKAPDPKSKTKLVDYLTAALNLATVEFPDEKTAFIGVDIGEYYQLCKYCGLKPKGKSKVRSDDVIGETAKAADVQPTDEEVPAFLKEAEAKKAPKKDDVI